MKTLFVVFALALAAAANAKVSYNGWEFESISTIFKILDSWNNGKLRHPLATLEGEHVFIFFYRALQLFLPLPPSLPPSLFSVALLAASSLWACAICLSSLFWLTFGGCVSVIPSSCRNMSLWKIMNEPWQEGITSYQVDKVLFLARLCLQKNTFWAT